MDKAQLRELVTDVLKYLEPEIPYSDDAVELLMLTSATESHCGKWIKQLGGPALGIFQMEPSTEVDIYDNYLWTFAPYKHQLRDKLEDLRGVEGLPLPDLRHNLAYQTAIARVHYWRKPEPLPPVDDVSKLATYWKRHWNTTAGKGTTEQAMRDYATFIKD